CEFFISLLPNLKKIKRMKNLNKLTLSVLVAGAVLLTGCTKKKIEEAIQEHEAQQHYDDGYSYSESTEIQTADVTINSSDWQSYSGGYVADMYVSIIPDYLDLAYD